MSKVMLVLLLFALCGPASLAKELTIVVTEITFAKAADATAKTRLKTLQKQTAIAFDTVPFAATDRPTFRDSELASIASYSISDRKLVHDGHPILPADRVLFQGVVDGADFVVVQTTHVSISPLNWFAAISGHPIQYGEILALSFPPDGKMRNSPLIAESKAADWRAEVFEQAPNTGKR
jgi:hypothetical protein